MFPTLHELFHFLFGIPFVPLPTFGFFVALSFITAAWLFAKELKRKEDEGLIHSTPITVTVGAPATLGELGSSFFFGFLIGYKLVYALLNWSVFKEDPRAVLLTPDGNLLAGIIIALLFVYQTYNQKRKTRIAEPRKELVEVHPYEMVGNFTMAAAIAGIIGARVFHILENWSDFLQDPKDMIFSTGGFTFYGGLIFGAAAVIIYARKFNISALQLIDACAPCLMLAYGIGRIGCQMSGDGDWGINNTHPCPSWIPQWMWSFKYPHNVIGEGIPIPDCIGRYCHVLPVGVYPTPFYESVVCILLFFVIWACRKKFSVPGQLFCFYLVLNGIERFLIEKIRINTVYTLFGHQITQAEIISALLVIAGLIGFVRLQKRAKIQKSNAT